jgi:hypothetical protein
MLQNLRARIRHCLHRAAEVRQRAEEVTDQGLRDEFLAVAERWALLARSERA